MRVIAIEEHCRTYPAPAAAPPNPFADRLEEVGAERLASMDAAGIDMQVLSQNSPAVDAVLGPEAIDLARRANDTMAEAVAAHPTRYAGFAALPSAHPEAAAAELERAVSSLGLRGAMINGLPGGRFMDDPAFSPIFERAVALDVPIYLHPAVPPDAVKQTYFSGFSPAVVQALSTNAWGWHIETGLHALRLILGGVFDRFPRLQVVIGHMGETLPFMIARADAQLRRASGLKRPLQEYFEQNFHITTSGFFTPGPLLNALLVLGAERIIFAVDYPYAENGQARAFLDAAPIGAADREKIAHENAERLLRL